MRHAVTNWREYEGGLRRRSSLTLWITAETIDGWSAVRRSAPGGQTTYSDGANQTLLMLRAAFTLALRQAEGLMSLIVQLLGCALAVPDHSSVSRRSARLGSITPGPLTKGPLHVLIDSTGLKVFSAGQWQVEKHGYTRRKSRKLHLGVDAGLPFFRSLIP